MMAKSNKRKSYADEMKYDFSPKMKSTIWTIAIVLLVFIVFYLISVKATGGKIFNSKKKDTTEEVEIQYEEILAGTSFNYGEDYIVVYYDMSDNDSDEMADLSSAVSNLKYSSSVTMYTCDLSNAFNKSFITEEEPNRYPTNALELQFNGPTVIRFINGEVSEYINGAVDVTNYLNSLSDINE